MLSAFEGTKAAEKTDEEAVAAAAAAVGIAEQGARDWLVAQKLVGKRESTAHGFTQPRRHADWLVAFQQASPGALHSAPEVAVAAARVFCSRD